MQRTIVLYRSISGSTKKYASWIAQDLKADLFDVREVAIDKLLNYDLIIFGGSLHAVGINGIKTIKDNLQRLADKKIIIFAVGASPQREGILEEIKNKNFSDEEQRIIQFFYLRGGFNYNNLDRTNKFLMKLLKLKLRLKRNRSTDEKGMLTAYGKPLDCTKKENIKELIEYARSLT